MSKDNILAKKIKKHFISINNTIESYFNNLRYFILNFKKHKFSTNNKVILVLGVLTISTLTYFLIPTFYNKNEIKSEIKNQIFKKYNLKIKFNESLNYGLLPKPHFHTKNLSIIRDKREIANVNNMKMFISINNFFSFKKTNLKDLIFKKTDFNIYKEDISFFVDLLKTEPNANKIIFKDSNIFFKDKEDEVLFINKTKKIEFFYDSKNLKNVLISKNEIFKIPFKFSVKNDKFNKTIYSTFDSSKIRLNISNEIDYNNDLSGLLDILFVNKNTSLNYKIKKDSLVFNSEKSNNDYNGIIEFKPFYLLANFNYDGLSTKNLFNDDSIFVDLIKSEIIKNRNLNTNINFSIKNITNIDELNNLNLQLAIEQGELVFSNSSIMWKEAIKITLNESLLNYDDDQINLVGRVIFDFKNIDNFYRTFQIKKNDRKSIKQIQIDFVYNFNNKEISFDNVKIDNEAYTNLQDFLDEFNSGKNRIFNKITFKNFINDFFSIYAG
jgi:hypothetical protein